MKKIIIIVLSILCCMCFYVTKAEGELVLFTTDDVSGKVGSSLTTYPDPDRTNRIIVVLGTKTNSGFAYQSDHTFDTALETLSKAEIDAMFVSKPLPAGVDVTITVTNPDVVNYDDEYEYTGLEIVFSNTIDSSFDPTDYTNNPIEMTIPKQYISNCLVDLSLDINNLSTGCYKIDYQKYTVTYDVLGHGTAPSSEDVIAGNKATKPVDPSDSEYSFEGWYKESTCDNAFDFNNETITSDITLYAKWKHIDTYTPPVIIDDNEPVYVPVLTCID